MKFHAQTSTKTNIEKFATDCLIFTTNTIHSSNYIKKIIKQEEIEKEHNINKTILLFNPSEISAKKLLLVGAGTKDCKLSELQFITMVKAIYLSLSKSSVKNLTFWLTDLPNKSHKISWHIYQIITNLHANLYHFDKYKSKKSKDNLLQHSLQNINFIVNPKELSNAQQAIEYAQAVANASKLTKDLANTPPNICNPGFLEKAAINLSKTSKKITLNILNKKDIEKLNMGAFLAVSKGSIEPPKLITLEYKGAKKTNQSPIVFIGKGVTFDTGGNSLKPSNYMVTMKYDMSGAATVLGLINFAIEMNLNCNIVGIMAIAENMPGNTASRPDDVVTTMSGLTVEILNTDAEGRLLLCEALTYCKKFKPKVVIDIATLTGACVAALGPYYTGLLSNNVELAKNLIEAGNNCYDKAWQFPLSEEYSKLLESNVADVANITGGSFAGCITAACFLEKFASQYKWAHLDIAGTATYQENKFHYATGRPIPMLAEYLIKSI